MKIDDVFRVWYVNHNPNSKLAYPPLMVNKYGPEKFRFAVTLSPSNAQTKKNLCPMHKEDSMLSKLFGAHILSSLISCTAIGNFHLWDVGRRAFLSTTHSVYSSNIIIQLYIDIWMWFRIFNTIARQFLSIFPFSYAFTTTCAILLIQKR